MRRKISKVAVLGSGVMGSRIACHFANIGCEVVLLDIVTPKLSNEEKKSKTLRNKWVNEELKNALKSNPSPIYDQKFAERITTGNFDDDMHLIKDADWIIEVVIENLEIKKQVFTEVEKHRKPGTIISSNTSGIPIHSMLEGRSEDFQKHFVGTHFFNPPRYLRLLEIIPTPRTDPTIVEFLMDYGDRFLGKATVHAKDTPAFIANRVGVFSVTAIFHLMNELGLTIEEVDSLTGPVSGKPKTATFRLSDLIGIDTLVKVANNTYKDCPNDEARDHFIIPDYILKMIEKGWVGDKAKQGFYKKEKTESGERKILALDIKTLEYKPSQKTKFATLDSVKLIEDLHDRLRALNKGNDKAAEFLRKLNHSVFQYCSNRIPEIADELYKIDDALKAGFAWEMGPFETWDVLASPPSPLSGGEGENSIPPFIGEMEAANKKPAQWVYDMYQSGARSFYKIENGVRKFYDISSTSYKPIPGTESFIILDHLRANKPVWKNTGSTIHDLGDDVLCVEFHTKMNSIGGEVMEGIHKAIDLAEKNYRGVVIGNDAPNFSAGANLALILMFAIEQEFDELDFAVRAFQNTSMKIRYSDIPVVIAPHGLTLGGGCEFSLHADKVVAAAETYIGLVEVGVGLIPGGGGTKEFVLRASDQYLHDDTKIPTLRDYFVNIATAKVATSAHEALNMDILKSGRDVVVVNQQRVLAEAKRAVIELSDHGYTKRIQRNDIRVLGRSGLGALLSGTYAFFAGNYATEHDMKITQKLAYVMCGGDLSAETLVSEQYLLDLEREAFLSLLGEKKTLERIQSILKTGKPLRN